ncbi:MAG: hypothetical protein ACK5O2_02070 [Microthrixaceae bacterium]
MTRTVSAGVVRHAMALVLFCAAALIVLQLRIGAVLVTLSPDHGIHSGDFLGVLAASVAAWLLAGAPGLAPSPARG